MRKIVTCLVASIVIVTAGIGLALTRSVEAQEPSFTAASIEGSYGFYFEGTTDRGAINSVGVFVADGNGIITSGSEVVRPTG